jgi:hypothetical protein
MFRHSWKPKMQFDPYKFFTLQCGWPLEISTIPGPDCFYKVCEFSHCTKWYWDILSLNHRKHFFLITKLLKNNNLWIQRNDLKAYLNSICENNRHVFDIIEDGRYGYHSALRDYVPVHVRSAHMLLHPFPAAQQLSGGRNPQSYR